MSSSRSSGTSSPPRSSSLSSLNSFSTVLSNINGNCPQGSLSKFVQEVEDNWSDSNVRPYRGLVVFTDGVDYVTESNTALSPQNAITALRQRCVPGITVSPVFGGSKYTTAQDLAQTTFLAILTSNNITSEFQMSGNTEQTVVTNIGAQLGVLAQGSASNSVCSDPTAYGTPSTDWCGYSTSPLCLSRNSCMWIKKYGCQKSTTISTCGVYTTKSACKLATGCTWNKVKGKLFICMQVGPPAACSTFAFKKACNSKGTQCVWNKPTKTCMPASS